MSNRITTFKVTKIVEYMIFVLFFSNTALAAFKLGVTSVSLSCALSAVMIYGNVIIKGSMLALC